MKRCRGALCFSNKTENASVSPPLMASINTVSGSVCGGSIICLVSKQKVGLCIKSMLYWPFACLFLRVCLFANASCLVRDRACYDGSRNELWFFSIFFEKELGVCWRGANGCFGQKRACAIPESAYCVARRNDGHKAGEVGENHGLVLTFVPIFRIGYDSHRSSLVGCLIWHEKWFYE